ncbi:MULTISPECIES: 3-hydroxyacyl-ACP dehydratase FabZ [Corallincola]|uniref:3-hydroxyacyl-[acyl-carrier-protein] dehydratase FabZ n=3 Tax=Corallincola TaxID=1775176 RepID=A0A368NE04_9GAMM|nr:MULTISPECIES: 3-hydroxyacyl-ACP dehydratase FabZ [Corallincola]RCU48877.1 3-hydroxyacyl-[acyl-carrier-protein] dehydratase FabZ [Corallincola holothuriorum]TAA43823.1 3-hydroxyacyl-ACP dehydratase FabZ [Corallincola spongiicola]TCI03073.1 3-hydroxyacyl-ACP dehydratase FabZ [Corallincola luteus]
MDIQDILDHLPHRYPFLLIDRVLDYEAGKWLHAIKNVTYNENFFPGHFPKKPVFPGVLILEAMAQATGILGYKSAADKPNENTIYYFASCDNARFKRPVVPGDTVHLEVELLKARRGMAKFDCVAKVDGHIVCSAEIMCAIREA